MKNLKRKKTEDPYQFKYAEIECPICMEEMKIDSRSVTAPCMHEFCLHCIGKWLMESSSRLCPLCKQMVKKIMYSIENQWKYCIIGFPGDFCTGWTVRNKIKSVFDDFDNVLQKIYGLIKNLFERDHYSVDTQILSYLVWFANVRIRVKSRNTGDEVTATKLLSDETNVTLIKDLLNDRLSMIFRSSVSNKIIADIYSNNNSTMHSVRDVLLYLEGIIDPEKLEILKLEVQCHLIMNQTDCDENNYIEYFLPLHHNDNDSVLFSDGRLVDEKLVAALVTKVLCSCNSTFDDERMLVAHVNIIHSFYTNFEASSSYDKLLVFMSEASHFILYNNPFYKISKLKNTKQVQSALISNHAYDLVKHCFSSDDFNHISATQILFEKQYIYVEPLLVEDSSDEDNMSAVSAEVEFTGVYLEISDSDSDALEMLSVQPAVYDLTDDVNDIDNISPDSNLNLSESSTVAMEDRSGPTASTAIKIETDNVVDQPQSSDIIHDDSGDSPNNRLGVTFIYEPRSAEDFYQYLLAEDSPGPLSQDQ